MLSASPGRLVGKVDVPLSASERQDEQAIDTFRAKLLAKHQLGGISELKAPIGSPL